MKNQKSKIKMERHQKRNSYEGLQENIRRLKTPKIEVWESQYKDKDYTVSFETNEFSCICPKTGLPDYAVIKIDYIPDRFCIELKSFKLYLISYRNIGVFHEHVINKILEDIVKACNPRKLKVTGEFNIRGGITTTVTREHKSSL